MAAAMLGLEDEDETPDPEEVKDVVGEVCNMISGSLKSDLCDAGLNCRLSPPAFTAGSDFRMESLYLTRQERLVFSHKETPIFVEVGLTAAEASP